MYNFIAKFSLAIDQQLAVDKQRAARAGRTRARNKKAGSDTESIGVGFTSAASETDNDSELQLYHYICGNFP